MRRIVPDMITTSGAGDQFCVRNLGNLVPPYGSNSNSVPRAASPVVAASTEQDQQRDGQRDGDQAVQP